MIHQILLAVAVAGNVNFALLIQEVESLYACGKSLLSPKILHDVGSKCLALSSLSRDFSHKVAMIQGVGSYFTS